MTTQTYTLESRLIAWCDHGKFYDGDYEGPNQPCPANPECNDFTDHNLRRRRAWVCSECGYAFLTRARPSHCDHLGLFT